MNSLLIDWLASTSDHRGLQIEIAGLLQITGAFSIKGAVSSSELELWNLILTVVQLFNLSFFYEHFQALSKFEGSLI